MPGIKRHQTLFDGSVGAGAESPALDVGAFNYLIVESDTAVHLEASLDGGTTWRDLYGSAATNFQLTVGANEAVIFDDTPSLVRIANATGGAAAVRVQGGRSVGSPS